MPVQINTYIYIYTMRYNRKSNNKNRNSRCDINLTKKCAYRIFKKKKTKARKKVSIHNRRKLKVYKKNNRTNELDKKKKKKIKAKWHNGNEKTSEKSTLFFSSFTSIRVKSLDRGKKKKEDNHTIVSLDSLTSYRHITDLYNKEKYVVTTSSRKKKKKKGDRNGKQGQLGCIWS